MVHYLAYINTNVTVGVLLRKWTEDSSNVVKVQKKKKKTEQPKHVEENVEKEVSKPVEENVEKGVSKEVIPSKSGIFKRKKKPAHRPRHSPEKPSVPEVEVENPT
ncbi:unnamed protein product [Lactuca virosa]|uniref:Uncharacterized protein n=1 Tax=Lactuca virosa TaxID=75947 RepID=A0AAU9LNM2_9ASTR|nr:unnamed protein product [Lactuca virosa]